MQRPPACPAVARSAAWDAPPPGRKVRPPVVRPRAKRAWLYPAIEVARRRRPDRELVVGDRAERHGSRPSLSRRAPNAATPVSLHDRVEKSSIVTSPQRPITHPTRHLPAERYARAERFLPWNAARLTFGHGDRSPVDRRRRWLLVPERDRRGPPVPPGRSGWRRGAASVRSRPACRRASAEPCRRPWIPIVWISRTSRSSKARSG